MAIAANNQKTTHHSTSSHSASPVPVASGVDSIIGTVGKRKRIESKNPTEYQVIGFHSDDQTKERTKKPARKKPRKIVAPPPKRLDTRTSSGDSMDLEDIEDKADKAKQVNDKEDDSEDVEEELVKTASKWTSLVYTCFGNPTIQVRNGRKYQYFPCLATPCTYGNQNGVRRYLDTADAKSTKGLKDHLNKCRPGLLEGVVAGTTLPPNMNTGMKDRSIAAFRCASAKEAYSKTPYNKIDSKIQHVLWCAEDLRPYTIVTDRGYNRLMKTGRPGSYIPSISTLSRDVHLNFNRARVNMKSRLKGFSGRLNFGAATWTSPNYPALLALTVHYASEGMLQSFLLDVVEVAKSQSGTNLAGAFHDVLEDFGISDKILAITCDNASSNDAMCDIMDAELANSFQSTSRSRCFAHIINLTAHTLTAQFDAAAKGAAIIRDAETSTALPEDYNTESPTGSTSFADGEPEERDSTPNVESVNSFEVGLEDGIDDLETMSEAYLRAFVADTAPVRRVLVKIRKLTVTIAASPTLSLPLRRKLCAEPVKKAGMLARDVGTCWNSTYDMLNSFLEFRPVIEAMAQNHENGPSDIGLMDEDWVIITQLKDVLEVFKQASHLFSVKDAANLADVIPVMDSIHTILEAGPSSTQYHDSIRITLALTRRTLNRYYNKTDASDAYRVAMLLHPQYKMSYWKEHGRVPKWIAGGIEITRRIFALPEYATSPELQGVPRQPGPENSRRPMNDGQQNQARLFFENLRAKSNVAPLLPASELDAFWGEPTADTSDPIAWWWARRATYPRLSRMAMDYLSIPATSMDVKRVFSQECSHLRGKVSPASIRALLCLGSWSRSDLLLASDLREIAQLRDLQGAEEADLDIEDLGDGHA